MSKIPIKVKKGKLLADEVSDDLKVDLRNNNHQIKQKQPSKKWLFLSIFLILVIIGLSANWFFSTFQKSAFIDLVPAEAIVFSLIDQVAFYEQTWSIYGFLKEKGIYGQAAIAKIGDYLYQANLDFKGDIQPLFENQIAFVLMPANSQSSFPFLLIFEKKEASAKLNQVLDKIEPGLKKDYNFSSETYRQIEITVLKPIFSPPDGFVYSQIEDYLIISNSQEVLRMIIDSIIES